MNFKAGDKVRPLNESGEGTVVSTRGKTVYVRMEDGFELPFPDVSLVLIPAADAPVKATKEVLPVAEEPEEYLQEEEEEKDEEQAAKKKTELEKGVYLAYELLHPKHFSNTALLLHLVNHTEYELQYSITMNTNGMQRCIAFNTLSANNKTLIEKVPKTEIESFCSLTVQLLFRKSSPFALMPPFSGTIRFKPTKLYKLNGFIRNEHTEHLAFFAPVLITEPNRTPVSITPGIADNIAKAILNKEKKHDTVLSKKHFHRSQQAEREVDLHIEELVDDLRGMSNGEIVQIQLKYFQRELDTAIADHLHKIIFIHGVGTGRLKSEIHRLLKSYDNVRFHDGSFSKYGFGATEVLIQ